MTKLMPQVLLLIIFMSKMHIYKAAFNIKLMFWRRVKYVLPTSCPCLLGGALEVNPGRAQVGHGTEQCTPETAQLMPLPLDVF